MILYNIAMILNVIKNALTSIILFVFLTYLIMKMHDDRK